MKQHWKTVLPNEAPPHDEKVLGDWLLEDIDGRGVLDRAQSTLTITPDHTVSGNTCLNRFSGKATIDGTAITFGPLRTTRRAGPPALMDQEKKYMSALEKVRDYRFSDTGLLFFTDDEGNDLLRFSPM